MPFCLYIDLPSKRPVIFSITLILFVSVALFNYLRTGSEPFLLLFGFQVILEALFQATDLKWLHYVHIPFVVVTGFFLGLKSIIAVMFLQPLLHVREIFKTGYTDALTLLGILYLTSLPVSLYLYKLKEKINDYRASFDNLQSKAKELADST